MQYYPFNSRSTLYRDKIGALAEGETLRLRLLLHKEARVHAAYLTIKEDTDQRVRECVMTKGEPLEDYYFYQCEITLTKGLYWYGFRYTSDYGEFFVSKTETGLGIVINNGIPTLWQQTVYDKNFTTPHWLKGGIIYQIFPDRFFCSRKEKTNVPTDRYLCENWEKQPEFRQTPGEAKQLGNDYYGGDLKGIEQKLDYLKGLGVTCIYLNPIFEAHSNHRYNTADYLKIDSLLGDEKDLESLVKKADAVGISIILDGVFSHTGDDSLYFNKYRRYGDGGAFNDPCSPYKSWYSYNNESGKYSYWWGVPSLPETNENDLSFSNFITGDKGVLRYWLKKGIRGWRLDVADELPDEFLEKIRLAIKDENPAAFLLGEVWEDASNKISYGARRKFLQGNQLDAVMNYPFANAIVDFLKGGSSDNLANCIYTLCENYPKAALHLLMNHIGTHDTPRILTRLACDHLIEGDREAQSKAELTREQYENGVRLLKLASVLQYTLPGVPSVYYGDEAGLTGYGDPFCRGTYPWGKENTELLEHYRTLGKLRSSIPQFKEGDFVYYPTRDGVFCFGRADNCGEALTIVNRNDYPVEITLPSGEGVTIGSTDYLIKGPN